MTQVKTRNVPKKYATTKDQQSILTLDAYGKINVIVIDNLDHFVDSLNLIKDKQLSISDLLNANIVYSLAAQLNLRVGLYKEADGIIANYIARHISDNILEEDKALVLSELKDSWQRLHQHPLAKRYVLCGKHQPVDRFYVNNGFAGFGSYEIFVKDYLYSLTRTTLIKWGDLPSSSMHLIDLVQRSLLGKNFFPNIFLELEHVISCLRWRFEIEQFEGIGELRTKLEQRLVEIKELWFDRVYGTLIADLDDIEKDFPTTAGYALAQVLDTGTCTVEENELARYLQPLSEYLCLQNKTQAFANSVKFATKECADPLVIFREAIRYAVVNLAQNRGLMLKQIGNVPFYFWAGKGVDKEERFLLPYLQQDGKMVALKEFELEALGNFCKHEVIIAMIEDENRTRAMAGAINGLALLTIAGLPRPMLFRQYGVQPMTNISVLIPKQQEEVLPEEIPDEENILKLTAQSSSCTLF